MSEVLTWLHREGVYLWYYLSIQVEQIAPYWLLGILIGSAVSVFGKGVLRGAFERLGRGRTGAVGIFFASLLGIASPLCMYGTIPIAASFSRQGMKDDYLAAFMMSSVLLNPQLLMYSAALGTTAVIVRFVCCLLCGSAAGLLVRIFYRDKGFFSFEGFNERASHDTDPNPLLRLLKNIGRNLRATGPMFLVGILLTALYQIHVPSEVAASLFGGQHNGFGVLMAATIGVPLYMCGGGTIPLLQQWLVDGMSMGSAAAFMITGPSTKLTNLGAMKIVLGAKRFALYIAFVMGFALLTGLIVDIII
ncbi:MAG: permease [Eubacteriales bacterium]|nr:permease [Eubacteriales bacterium]